MFQEKKAAMVHTLPSRTDAVSQVTPAQCSVAKSVVLLAIRCRSTCYRERSKKMFNTLPRRQALERSGKPELAGVGGADRKRRGGASVGVPVELTDGLVHAF